MSEKHSLQAADVGDTALDRELSYPDSATASTSPGPPPFSSLYFPPSSPPSSSSRLTACSNTTTAVVAVKVLITEPAPPSSLPIFALDAAPLSVGPSCVAVELKAALPRDTKGEASGRGFDDGEPPPPYTEGSSPLDGFQYVMAAAAGAASILTQVQQGGPPQVNALGGTLWHRWEWEHSSLTQKQMLDLMSISPWT